MEKVEIIDFNLPLGENKSIFIPQIPWKRSPEELKFAIENRYRKFGLIHSVIVQEKGHQIFKSFINFYSFKSAKKARQETHGSSFLLSSTPLIVNKGRGFSQDRALNHRECIELANHYFGFNGWSYKIIYHRSEIIDENQIYWVSVVRVLVGELSVEGIAKEPLEDIKDPSLKGASFGRVQKQVSKSALANALNKLLIVVYTQGSVSKAKVEIDNSVKDPFYYDPLWESTSLELTEFSHREEDF